MWTLETYRDIIHEIKDKITKTDNKINKLMNKVYVLGKQKIELQAKLKARIIEHDKLAYIEGIKNKERRKEISQ